MPRATGLPRSLPGTLLRNSPQKPAWRASHRTICAGLVLGSARAAGGELEQIQFLLGHVSVQTTERYLGGTQRIASAVNDRIGIEPDVERFWKDCRQSGPLPFRPGVGWTD